MGLAEQYYAFRRIVAAQIRKLLLQPGTRRRCVRCDSAPAKTLKTQAHFGKPPLIHEAMAHVRVPAQVPGQSKQPEATGGRAQRSSASG